MTEQERALLARRYQNKINNAQGHSFEDYIKAACALYKDRGRASVDKTPEPFRVLEKSRDGIFKGRFTARAQPDFQGTLAGGRSIVFEAKYTTTDRLKRDVLTSEQQDALEDHRQKGAVAAVCAGIGNDFFFVPWAVWRDMKEHFGRKYVTAADLEQWRDLTARSSSSTIPTKGAGAMSKGKQHTQKLTVRVTPQTAYNLERLMHMSGQKTPGRVVDKLVREKMLALRGRGGE